MDWTAGYASDVEYVSGFYREQDPQLLNFVCALNGYEPATASAEYNYFELGFGRGYTVNLLAAANPKARFYAADFNPAHVAGAQALAQAAELGNLTLLENSFAELSQGAVALPQFDYITLHGIYTWITAENRQHIVEFLARYLKPGGVVYLSYNSMPGWTSALPMQRLLVEYGDAHPNRSDLQIDGAAEFIQQLSAAGAAYFHIHPSNQPRFDTLKTAKRAYLVHEYMHKHWQPMYHADVARQLGEAKLDFAGSADMPYVYTQLYLTPEKLTLINRMPDPAMRETLKDYFLNTAFRKDVFIRGRRRMAPLRRRAWLLEHSLALLVKREQVKFELKLIIGTVNGSEQVYGPICDALAQRPHTLAELVALPALASMSFENVVQTAALLTASGQAALYRASPASDSSRRMNLAVANQTVHGDESNALCSTLMGTAIGAGYFEQIVYGLLARINGEVELEVLVQGVWQVMQTQGRRMVREGLTLETPEDNLAELRLRIAGIVQDTLPRWRQLGIV